MTSPFVQPDSEAQNGATYKNNLDNAAAVFKRVAASFHIQAQDVPDMTVRCLGGALWVGTLLEVSPGNSTTIVAPVTNNRIDRIVLDRLTGVITVVTGTEGAIPVSPAIPANKRPLARIHLSPGQTEIVNADIADERVFATADVMPAINSGDAGKMLALDGFLGRYVHVPGVGKKAGMQTAYDVVNTVEFGNDLSNAYWTKAGASIVVDSGYNKIVEDTSTGNHFVRCLTTFKRNEYVTVVIKIKKSLNRRIGVRLSSGTGGGSSSFIVYFDNVSGSGSFGHSAGDDAEITDAFMVPTDDGEYRIYLRGRCHASDLGAVYLHIYNFPVTPASLSYAGDGASGIEIMDIRAGTDVALPAVSGALLTGVSNDTKVFFGKILHLQDQRTSGTAGGTSTSGSWQIRTLNTKPTDTIGSTLSSNTFTLPAGTYFIDAKMFAFYCQNVQSRLYNITDSDVTLYGLTCHYSAGSTASVSPVSGTFTITAQKTFRIETRVTTTRASDGYGVASSFGSPELYADILIRKVA